MVVVAVVGSQHPVVVRSMWFSRAAALGCLHPSEHTVKTWTVFLFLARHGGSLGSLAEHNELALRQEQGRVRSTFNRIKVMHPAAFKDQDIQTLPIPSRMIWRSSTRRHSSRCFRHAARWTVHFGWTWSSKASASGSAEASTKLCPQQ